MQNVRAAMMPKSVLRMKSEVLLSEEAYNVLSHFDDHGDEAHGKEGCAVFGNSSELMSIS